MEIIYSAKLGTLGSMAEIYERIFSPSSYYVFDHRLLKFCIKNLRNPFLDHCPEMDSGAHASVPTVLEETFAQRRSLERLGVQTIDNEISQMAQAVAQFNQLSGTRISYFSLHFATDYLRMEHEKLERLNHDLSRNRIPDAAERKLHVIGKIASLIGNYLEET